MRTTLFIAVTLLACVGSDLAQSTGPTIASRSTRATAFTNVNVIPMDSEITLQRQTVVVQNGRITAVGPSTSTPIPVGTNVIDGSGRYLMPGLADMHVHLEGRGEFGDAPLFLAYGITTVLNLRGRPEILDWKMKIAEGKLLAPNLYSSGEFVNEPRISTPREAEDEVIRQKADGYDVIKFHEIVVDGRYLTMHGLSRPAYDAMNSTAHRIGIPLIGHAPDSLGLQAVLDDHQSLAHSGILVALYFLPGPTVSKFLLPSVLSLGVVLLLAFGSAVTAAAFTVSGRGITFASECKAAVAMALLCLLFVLLWPVLGLLSGSTPFLILLSIVVVLITSLTLTVAVQALQAWRRKGASVLIRLSSTVLAIVSLAFTLSLGLWLPLAWRSSEPNLKTFATKCRQAGIWVEPTLDIYQIFNRMNDGHSAELLADPVNHYLPPNIQADWAGIPSFRPPLQARVMGFLFRRTLLLSQRVTGSLQQAGVPLMLGTDTFGFPFCIPGKSAHDEMDLMRDSGLTPFQVLRSATINPARFLGKESEFGTVTVGKRADLLLVESNPLVDLEASRAPDGVMIRGVWLPSEKLRQMLAGLDETGH
jgi:hypothetical protein